MHYEPAESASKIKGGNSNWRGPIWFPTSFLLIESLRNAGGRLRPDLSRRHAAPARRRSRWAKWRAALATGLFRLFLRDDSGRRPVYDDTTIVPEDPNWRDYLLFYEYFNGDTGQGLGASAPDGLDGPGGDAHRRVAEIGIPGSFSRDLKGSAGRQSLKVNAAKRTTQSACLNCRKEGVSPAGVFLCYGRYERTRGYFHETHEDFSCRSPGGENG